MDRNDNDGMSQSKTGRPLAVLLCAVLLSSVLTTLGALHVHNPIASAETQFVEYSADGLQIVPASCASAPPQYYYDANGQYNYGSPPFGQWGNPYLPSYNGFIVGGTCNPGDALISSSYCYQWIDTGCSASCPVGQYLYPAGSGACYSTCPSGLVGWNGTCVSSCPSSMYISAGTCVFSCPTGQASLNGTCVPYSSICTSPQIYNPSNGACVAPPNQCLPGSPAGYYDQDGNYVGYCEDYYGGGYDANGNYLGCGGASSATPADVCSGNNLYHEDAACNFGLAQTCSYGCSNGACTTAPPPSIIFNPFAATTPPGGTFTATGHLQVVPALAHAGGTVQIYWNTSNTASCSVTGTNGDTWTNVFFSGSAGKKSNVITKQTTYTLYCTAQPGVTPASVTESVVVNVIPTFQEQ